MNELAKKINYLIFFSGQSPGLIKASVEDTMREWREVAANEIAAEINADRSIIRDRIGITPAVRAMKFSMQARIFLKSKPIPLEEFNPKRVRKGVVIRISRGGGGELVRGAFGPNIPKLGRGVWRRTSRERKPIKKIPGVSLAAEPAAQKALRNSERKVAAILYRVVHRRVKELVIAMKSARRIYEPVSWDGNEDLGGDKLTFNFVGVNHFRDGFRGGRDVDVNDYGFILSSDQGRGSGIRPMPRHRRGRGRGRR